MQLQAVASQSPTSRLCLKRHVKAANSKWTQPKPISQTVLETQSKNKHKQLKNDRHLSKWWTAPKLTL